MKSLRRDIYIGIPEFVLQERMLSALVFALIYVHENGFYPGRLRLVYEETSGVDPDVRIILP